MPDKKRLGFALCGSFCTFKKVLSEMEKLSEIYDITPLVGKNRELEIITYLEMHPNVEEFLILDEV